MTDFNDILNKQINGYHYFSHNDLRMNKNYGFMLSRNELNKYNKFKEDIKHDLKHELPLISFNSSSIYYFDALDLSLTIDEYFSLLIDYNQDNPTLELIISELLGSLKIEGVNTTRTEIEAIINNKNDNDSANEIIIKNMYDGLKFIMERPEFNKDNFLKLYRILSKNSLAPDLELKPNDYYRYDKVYINNHEGCPHNLISAAMDSLFKYVNDNLASHNYLLPYISHYYISYIHLYFDYNGRMARMASLWVGALMKMERILPIYISEAINYDKNNYYKALEASREANDLTYFLIYLTKLSNVYLTIYKNLDSIKLNLNENAFTLTNREVNYLKAIIINGKKNWFNYLGFLDYAGINITKQGALKILNRLAKMGLLNTKINKSKEKLFQLNENIIQYELRY